MLEIGELRVTLKPCVPAGDERGALALSCQDAVKVATMDAEFLGSDRGPRKTDMAALGLVRGSGHGNRCCDGDG